MTQIYLSASKKAGLRQCYHLQEMDHGWQLLHILDLNDIWMASYIWLTSDHLLLAIPASLGLWSVSMVMPLHDNHILVPVYLLLSSFEGWQMQEPSPCTGQGQPINTCRKPWDSVLNCSSHPNILAKWLLKDSASLCYCPYILHILGLVQYNYLGFIRNLPTACKTTAFLCSLWLGRKKKIIAMAIRIQKEN